jgi:hypothetical protein
MWVCDKYHCSISVYISKRVHDLVKKKIDRKTLIKKINKCIVRKYDLMMNASGSVWFLQHKFSSLSLSKNYLGEIFSNFLSIDRLCDPLDLFYFYLIKNI